MASIEIKTNEWPVKDVLSLLLTDRSTKKNIIFATDSYEDLGSDYWAKNQITENMLACMINAVAFEEQWKKPYKENDI